MTNLHRNKYFLLTLSFGFVIVALYVLGVFILAPSNNGKYLEKASLESWMTALAFTVSGLGKWQTRLWAGMYGLFGIGVTSLAGWRLYGGRIGMYAALVLGSCFYWAAASRLGAVSAGLSGTMGVTLCCLLLAQRDAASASERRNWMLVFWSGTTLAVLSGGMIFVLITGAVLVAYSAAARHWNIWRHLYLGRGMLLFLGAHLIWAMLAGLHNPGRPYSFFIHDDFGSVLLTISHRREAWWTCLVLLVMGSMPWLGLLMQSLAMGARRNAGRFQPRLLLLVWVLVMFTLLVTSGFRLLPQMLLVFPAVALLIGHYLAVGPERHLAINASAMYVLGLVLLGLAPFITRFGDRTGEAALYAACRSWMMGAGLVALAGSVCALYFLYQSERDRMVIALALAGLVIAELLLAGFVPIAQAHTDADFLPAMRVRRDVFRRQGAWISRPDDGSHRLRQNMLPCHSGR